MENLRLPICYITVRPENGCPVGTRVDRDSEIGFNGPTTVHETGSIRAHDTMLQWMVGEPEKPNSLKITV